MIVTVNFINGKYAQWINESGVDLSEVQAFMDDEGQDSTPDCRSTGDTDGRSGFGWMNFWPRNGCISKRKHGRTRRMVMRDFQKGDLVWFNDNLHTVSSVLYGAVCLEDWPDPVYDRSQLSPYSKPIVDCNAKADPEKIQEFADRAMGDREEPQWRSMETAPKKELLDIIAKGWYLRKDGTREEFGVSRIHWYKTRWDDDWGATFEPIGWMPWPTAEEPA